MVALDKYVLYGGPERDDVDEGTRSIGEFLMKRLAEHGDKVALIDGVTSNEITYTELLSKSVELAQIFLSVGIKKNDVVAIYSENRFEFPIVLFASLYIGAKVSPLNVTYTERELVHSLSLSHPKIIFTSPFGVERAGKVAQQSKFLKHVVLFGDEPAPDMRGITLFPDFIKKHARPVRVQFKPEPVDLNEQVALILCSSGTTGQPKGVQLTHGNIVSSTVIFGDGMKKFDAAVNTLPIILGVIPWFHAFGCLTILGVCISGVKLVFLPKFEEGLFLSCIEAYKVNTVFMVPPLMVFLAKHPLVDTYDLSSLIILSCGAASLRKEVEDAVIARLKNPKLIIRQGYGLSETTLAVTAQQIDSSKPGGVGCLTRGIWGKVIDIETGKSLGPGKPGELCFKGSKIMKGYIGDEKATREAIDKDGWLHTGDVGYYDDDFQFYIVDRIKELIKYKAYQVPPAEIEALLLTHPKIMDAAVIGKPDNECGELPMAFVVKKPGVELTEEEVKNFVKENVSGPKQLRGGVQFIDAIPKNPSGKILRRVLKDSLLKMKSKL